MGSKFRVGPIGDGSLEYVFVLVRVVINEEREKEKQIL